MASRARFAAVRRFRSTLLGLRAIVLLTAGGRRSAAGGLRGRLPSSSLDRTSLVVHSVVAGIARGGIPPHSHSCGDCSGPPRGGADGPGSRDSSLQLLALGFVENWLFDLVVMLLALAALGEGALPLRVE